MLRAVFRAGSCRVFLAEPRSLEANRKGTKQAQRNAPGGDYTFRREGRQEQSFASGGSIAAVRWWRNGRQNRRRDAAAAIAGFPGKNPMLYRT
jgi:hypothetical protein